MTPADGLTDAAASLHGVLVERMAASHPVLDRPLGELTTYRVGGSARLFVEVESVGDLEVIAEALVASPVPTIMVGRGSNLLVADEGFDGVALRLGEAFASVEITGTDVKAGGAASLPVVARQTVSAGLTGFEWAVGVPGSIGGAVRMNAGGHGSDMDTCVSSIQVVDLSTGVSSRISHDELSFGYRRSSIASSQVVVEAVLTLDRGSETEGQRLLTEIVSWRRENQPGGQNAGSVFTNPPGDSAGRLIDVTGCKGLRIGSAVVSTKHANFIQADAGGRAGDVKSLMDEVRRRVLEATGIELTPETRMVGFADPVDEVGFADPVDEVGFADPVDEVGFADPVDEVGFADGGTR
jgi:UDP-N-acetylmuramate dehydrogenase